MTSHKSFRLVVLEKIFKVPETKIAHGFCWINMK